MAELIAIPLKTSSDVDIVKPLKNLILSANPGECNEEFTEALNELARLRTNVIWKVSDKSSLEALYNYYDQIAALAGKIPPQEVQIPFKWRDAFDKGSLFGGKRSLTVSSLEYERLCILFNMAAMQSAAAAAETLDTEDSLKLAAKMLQQAAGALEAVRARVLLAVQQDPTPDLHPDSLAALAQLMLAQAQEVCVLKCMRDHMKDASIAKVAAHADDLYGEAARLLARAGSGLPPELGAACTERALAMRGLAQLHAAYSAAASAQHGERVARLRAASELLARVRLPLYREYSARAARALAEAVRENDFVYHEPEPRDLAPLARAPVVRAAEPPPAWSAAPNVWARLPAPQERAARQEASDRRAALAANEIRSLREATAMLTSVLASLGLPGAAERSVAGELPEAVKRRAEAVRARGGADALQALADALPALLARNTELLDEAQRMLREEAEADRRLRDKFGDRWTRSESARLTEGLRANADKYRGVVDGAARADQLVRARLAQHAPAMRRLVALADGDAGALGGASGGDCPEAAAVRELMRQAEELRAARAALEDELKAAHAGTDEALEALRTRARDSRTAQEALLAEVRAAAARLPPAPPSELGALDAAHDACLELHANLTEGTTFYTDLTHLLLAFQNKVADYCFARDTEKEELLAHLSRDAARPQPQAVPRREAPAAPAAPIDTPDARAAPTPGHAHTLPYPVQPQGMPVPLGGAYFPTPLPTLYNPYATLPYPHHYPPHYPYPPPPQ